MVTLRDPFMQRLGNDLPLSIGDEENTVWDLGPLIFLQVLRISCSWIVFSFQCSAKILYDLVQGATSRVF